MESRRRKRKKGETAVARKIAFGSMKKGVPYRMILEETDESLGTLSRMKRAARKKYPNKLRALLHPDENPSGRRSCISASAKEIIVEKMVLAASHGLAIEKTQLQALGGQVASELERPFEKGVPCDG